MRLSLVDLGGGGDQGPAPKFYDIYNKIPFYVEDVAATYYCHPLMEFLDPPLAKLE